MKVLRLALAVVLAYPSSDAFIPRQPLMTPPRSHTANWIRSQRRPPTILWEGNSRIEKQKEALQKEIEEAERALAAIEEDIASTQASLGIPKETLVREIRGAEKAIESQKKKLSTIEEPMNKKIEKLEQLEEGATLGLEGFGGLGLAAGIITPVLALAATRSEELRKEREVEEARLTLQRQEQEKAELEASNRQNIVAVSIVERRGTVWF